MEGRSPGSWYRLPAAFPDKNCFSFTSTIGDSRSNVAKWLYTEFRSAWMKAASLWKRILCCHAPCRNQDDQPRQPAQPVNLRTRDSHLAAATTQNAASVLGPLTEAAFAHNTQRRTCKPVGAWRTYPLNIIRSSSMTSICANSRAVKSLPQHKHLTNGRRRGATSPPQRRVGGSLHSSTAVVPQASQGGPGQS